MVRSASRSVLTAPPLQAAAHSDIADYAYADALPLAQALESTPSGVLRDGLWLLAIALVVIATALVWAIVLKRQVRRQTRALAERHREDLALRQRYEEIVENATDTIYTHDLEGRFTSINRAGERLAGYTRQQCELLSFHDLIADVDLERVRAELAASIAVRLPVAFRARMRNREGREIPVEIHARPVFSGDTPVAVEGIARDLTERERVEEELREAQKMEAVGQLAAGIAHDFNNLLTIVLAQADFIGTRVEEDKEAREAVAEVQKAAGRAAALTAQMLAFARRQFLAPTVVDLNDVVREMTPLLDRAVGAEVELSVRLADEPLRVRIDRGQMEQALIHLGVNARDAMPGGGRFSVCTSHWRITEPEDSIGGRVAAIRPGTYARLTVTDTGSGMTPDVLTHVFEPFFSTKGPGAGSGLGLAMIYGFIRQSGGRIDVSSTPGRGTVFELFFPLSAEQPAAASVAGRVVLVAEDDPPVRRLIVESLKKEGVVVLEAVDGEQARAIVETHDGGIDLLLTDLKMPRMGGTDLARWLAFQRPGVRVLFMSGYAAPPSVTAGQFGPQAFIQKPFTRSDLLGRIQALLAASDARIVARTSDTSTS